MTIIKLLINHSVYCVQCVSIKLNYVYLTDKETNGGNDAKQGVTAYDDSEVEAKSDSDIKTIELESNPSYQPMTIEPSVTDPTYEEMETKLQMTDNPAYGSAQTNARTDSCYSNL